MTFRRFAMPMPLEAYASAHHPRDWGFLRPFTLGFCLTAMVLLSGCSIATLPVKATSKVVDWSTTSQDEADRNRGRDMRRQEEERDRCLREGYGDC